MKNYIKGIILCLIIAVPSWFIGKRFPIIGGAVIAILAGMVVTLFIKDKTSFETGIKFFKENPSVGGCSSWLWNES